MEICVPREYTKAERAKDMEANGKSRATTAGSWVHDLCALKKVVTLCSFCQHKFNPGRLGYIQDKEFPIYQAKCDGCEVFDPRCKAYFFEETFKQVRSTAAHRRAEKTAFWKQRLKES